MSMLDGKVTDLSLGEVRSVLATIAGIEVDSIREWMIVIGVRHDCGDPECEAGDVAILNSQSGEHVPEVIAESFSLRLAADATRSIALRLAGE